ncbi:hypothetical protein ACFQ4C_23085 [Larkinella insperata]|uniref:Uncharacterized protein n=1 Tax=Larkinella insperata TaxID=332158 RepID=A0ABW3QLC6_9BACT
MSSFQLIRRSWRMVLWLYGVNFLMSLLVLLPAYATFRRDMGASLEYLKLLNGFDFTVYSDFRHNHGSATNSLLTVGFWLGLLYLLISVFFTGGLLQQVASATDRRQTFRLSRFLAAGAQGFGRFFRLFLCVSSFIFLLSVVFLLAGGLSALALTKTLNEEELSYVALAFLLVFALSALLALCVGDYAKIRLFRRDETRAVFAFWVSMRFLFSRVRVTFGNYLLLIGVGLACFGVYFLLESWIVTRGWAEIALLFLIQQLFIISRTFLKVWVLATATVVFTEQEKQPTISPAR